MPNLPRTFIMWIWYQCNRRRKCQGSIYMCTWWLLPSIYNRGGDLYTCASFLRLEIVQKSDFVKFSVSLPMTYWYMSRIFCCLDTHIPWQYLLELHAYSCANVFPTSMTPATFIDTDKCICCWFPMKLMRLLQLISTIFSKQHKSQ